MRLCFRRYVLLFTLPLLLSAAVDINNADFTTLMKIKGVGEVKAEAILAYRKRGGCFKRIEDLDKVKGFGEKFIAKHKKQKDIIANGNCKKPSKKDGKK